MDRREPDGEDCLNINIFTPGVGRGDRPVMVWLHGGGFSGGSGNWTLYDGTNLARKENVVVVSVTHRLNIFGFMSVSAGGEKYANSANVGMQDVVAALAWIKDNISAFGGNPGNVTIFGQSGGGGKVTTLMAMPSAKGLFHRAIAQSGSAMTGTLPASAAQGTERLMSKLGLRPNQIDELQKMTFQQIQQAADDVQGLSNGPVIDGKVLPRNQWSPTAPEDSATVPLMMGSTETENGWVGPPALELSDAEMLRNFSRLAGSQQQPNEAKGRELIALYKRIHPNKVNQMLWLTAESDNSRRFNAQQLGRLKAAQGKAPSYLYFFNWYSPVYDNRMGAYHTLDIAFALYNVDIATSMTGSQQRRYALAHKMSATWAAFARTGNPNNGEIPQWPAFDPNQYPTMVFGDEVKMVNDPNREERAALQALRDSRPTTQQQEE
jgi:para-nitrobenzyl esterase